MQLLTAEQFSSNYKVDVSKYVETINGGRFSAKYISWANAVLLLKTYHPELSVAFEKMADGSPVFRDGENAFLQPYVTDGEKRTASLFYPVMDSRHNAIINPNACEINKAFQRATAKAVSVFTGLGLSLFNGEDLPAPAEDGAVSKSPTIEHKESKRNLHGSPPLKSSGSFSGAWTDYKITFGKHNGKSLGEIAVEAPTYLEFLTSDKFEIKSPALQEAVDGALKDIKQGYSEPVETGLTDEVSEQTAQDEEDDEDVPY